MIDLAILGLLLGAAAWALTQRRRQRAGEPGEGPRSWSVTIPPTVPASGKGRLPTALSLAEPPGRVVAGSALIAALLLIGIGQQSLGGLQLGGGGVIAYGAGLALIAGLNRFTREPAPPTVGPGGRPGGPHRRRSQGALLGGALGGSFLIWLLMRGRQPTDGYGVVALLWVLAMVAAVLASNPAWTSPRQWHGTVAVTGWPHRGWLLFAGLAIGALLLRVVDLERFPYTFGGDEGSQGMSAIAVLEGRLATPFGTGWFSIPTLFFFLQAASIQTFGDSVAGVRALSGLVGTATVLFTYLLARRLLGQPTAVIAACLLAVFHFHLHFSRLASIQVMDALTVVVVLYLLHRGVVDRRPTDCLLAGFAVGLSQYSSPSARIIPIVAGAYAIFLIVRGGRQQTETRPNPLQALPVRLVAWIAMGSLIAYLPLMTYYVDHPDEFSAPVSRVSMFTSGWLEREQQTTGKGTTELVLNQILRAALLPFHTQPGGLYSGARPFSGPMAAAMAIGLALVTVGAFRREYFGVAVAYWASVIGLGLTEDPTQTQRFVMASPLMAMAAAIGIFAVLRLARDLAGVPRVVVGPMALAIVGAIAAWNFQYYFFAPNQTDRYGGTNGLVATELANYLRSLGPGSTVYFLGPPRMWYYGFQTLPFIARGARGIDVEQPWAPGGPLPTLEGPTVFAALPERAGELQQVYAWFPGGQRREFQAENGSALFTVYAVRRNTPAPAGVTSPLLPHPGPRLATVAMVESSRIAAR